jgi:PAS domain S-box-containing protein
METGPVDASVPLRTHSAPTRAPERPNSDYASVLQTILDASTEYAIVATQLDGTFLLWNEGARRIYGYEPAEVLGRNIRILHLPSDVDSGKIDEIFATALEHGGWDGVLTRLRKGGGSFPVRIVLTVRRDENDEPIGFLSISKDISHELWLNQRLLASEAYNRVLIESTLDGLLTTDLDGVITDVNKEMERITGASRERLINRPLAEYVVPAGDAASAIRRVLKEGHVTGLEMSIRHTDGSVRDYAFNASMLVQDPERVRGIIVTIRDVTDQKRLRELLEIRNRELEVQNEQVVEANRLKNEFLASMSHELRTPLNSIIGFSDFLLTADDAPLRPDQREHLTHILNSGNHLLSLINDILDLAKVESGKLELSPAPTDVRAAVNEVCASLQPQLAERQLELTSEVDPAVVHAVLDPVRFKQILYNLLSNAVKFTPPNGSVEVSVAPSGGARFALRVRDTGIGIPADQIDRIFREFEQLDTGPGRRYSGTGLGLPLTRKLVELMGGSITVRSEVGVGSTFTARLPFVPVPDAPSGPPKGGAA